MFTSVVTVFCACRSFAPFFFSFPLAIIIRTVITYFFSPSLLACSFFFLVWRFPQRVPGNGARWYKNRRNLLLRVERFLFLKKKRLNRLIRPCKGTVQLVRAFGSLRQISKCNSLYIQYTFSLVRFPWDAAPSVKCLDNCRHSVD